MADNLGFKDQGLLGYASMGLFGQDARDAGKISESDIAKLLATSGRAETAGIEGLRIDPNLARRRELLAGALEQSALGTGGPSVAENMLRQEGDLNQRQLLSAALAAPGVNPAMALRAAQNAGVLQNAQTASNAATLRAQEQLSARNALLAALGQQDDQETRRAMGLAQLGDQRFGRDFSARTFNANAALAGQAQQDRRTGGLLSGISSAAAAGVGGA
ncbi:MAG: hypothetical protein E6Q97_37495 [Desulfurellales bacterium]|nr:MAG: hypothetical protein E6Q97_37495 [Desulfurellales bacterium]